MEKQNHSCRLSIAIITMNAAEELYKCLNSLYEKIKGVSFEIILVDNNSQDNTISMVNKYFPEVVLIKNSRNRGVAPARNQALRQCKGDYILILDADTEIISDNLDKLLEFVEQDEKIGIAGCTLVSENNELHSSTRTFPKPIHILLRRLFLAGLIKDNRILREHHLMNWDRQSPRIVDFVEGAFQLIRKSVMQEIGLLDEKMFYGFEDADYCARMKMSNYKIVCYPDFKVRHSLKGVTRGNPFNKMAYFHTKSYFRFYRKHRALINRTNVSKGAY